MRSTVTDGDGDISTATAPIGGAVQFSTMARLRTLRSWSRSSRSTTTGHQGNETTAAGVVAVRRCFTRRHGPDGDGRGTNMRRPPRLCHRPGPLSVRLGRCDGGIPLSVVTAVSGLSTTDGHAITLLQEGTNLIVGRFEFDGVPHYQFGHGGVCNYDRSADGVMSAVQYVSLHHNTADGPGLAAIPMSR